MIHKWCFALLVQQKYDIWQLKKLENEKEKPIKFPTLFSSPEPKAQVSYCQSAPSVVRRRPSGVNFHIFDFSSETAERNSTKLDWKQDLNALYQVCVFRADRRNKMAALAQVSYCQSAPSVVRRRPSGVNFHIFDFSSETAERNSTKLDWKQDLNALYQVCVFRADRRNKMAALASDWLRHFDFSSVTAERNSTKLDRKQDLKALYQVCVFRADRKNKMAALASDWLRHFRLLL